MKQADVHVFVLGGAGYIGSHVCKALHAKGYVPVVIDNLSQGYRESVLWGPLHVVDINDTASMIELISGYNPAAMVHLAAYLSVGESVSDPHKYYLNNLKGTLSVLEAIKQTKTIPLVFSSTAAVYGSILSEPVKESVPLFPLNPYGRSKYMVEQILSDYARAYDIPSVSLRYFNAAGADSELETGSRQKKPSNLVPLILKAIESKASVEIYGNDYPTKDGTCLRDYIHVSDLASAHVKVVEKLISKESLPLALNLGTGVGYSVMEVVSSMEEACGRKIEYRIVNRRPGDGAALVADATLAKSLLDWKPASSSLFNICQTAWKWHCHMHSVI